MSRIIVFGATGLTGRLTAAALVKRGRHPVLAGRSQARLEEVNRELEGDLELAVADAADPASLERLAERGDVLVSTVGPFVRSGEATVHAALAKGAHYLDSNGEPPFTRRVFEQHGPAALEAGISMLTAFGWESVLGNVAGARALQDGGAAAVRVDIGYFYTGLIRFSPGTRASLSGAMVLPSFAHRDGAIRTVRGADRYRKMPVQGMERPGVAFGAADHFTLPRSFPQLREVNTYLGWFGRLSRPMHMLSRAGFAALKVPGVRALYEAAARRYVRRSKGGPDAQERRRGGVHVVGIAYDSRGTQLSEVHLAGVEGYEFTAGILAWGADRVAAGDLKRAGALGPIEAFGIDALEIGCREAGVSRLAGAVDMWPDTIDEILGGDQAVALAHVTPAEGVVLTPVTNFALRDREAGTVAVNSSVGMWRKLDRIQPQSARRGRVPHASARVQRSPGIRAGAGHGVPVLVGRS